ncbi:winged helix-turn-helix domain-containing protein [Pseudoalteromonas sp. MMG013]|uniref:winged helix-turn-helix domain-containing protein n=1 Tax=Pseudoalteromonas sp. MMG013 TaxID=2822687 RepID=UPI001B36832A|nr:winged helix-turn-helix domain-containing protein [Pseudoalteromonas sp. MMG013]MBQ4864052.1 winged helix-turn-helix domain-containing protein [Pseudoalteromonas sp. MMG013]
MNEVSFSRKVKEVKFGEWSLDPKRQTIHDGEVERELEPLLFNILCYLAINCEQIITRQDLVDDVWKQNYVDDNAINRAMSELRKVLKSERQKGIIVKTHYRKGYSFFLEPIIIYHQSSTDKNQETNKKESVGREQNNAIELEKSTSKRGSSSVKKAVIMTFFTVVLSAAAYQGYRFKTDVKVQQKSIEESVLSWLPGRYTLLTLSPDKKQVAFSFIPNDSQHYSLVVKGLNGGQEKRLGEEGVNYLPLGWSVDSNAIFYRATTKDKCQVWRLNADFNSDNQFLFDCNLNDSMTGGGAGNNRFIYSKTGYRNRDELAALVNRSLATGDEFQITSPNLNSYGDRFLSYIPGKELILFERRQYDINELYVTDPDGGNQEKLFETSHRIWAVTYDEPSGMLVWLDNTENIVYEYDLFNRKIHSIVELETDKTYASFQAFDKDSLLLVSYPFLRDIHQFNLQTNDVSIVDESDYEDRSGIEVDDGYLFLTRRGSESFISFTQKSSNERQPLQIPKGRLSAIRYNYDTEQLLLQHAEKIELYDYKTLRLVDTIRTEGTVISAEFLGKEQIGFVVVSDKKIKSKTFRYSINDKKKVEVPALTSLWIGHLDESTLVSLSSNDKVVLYDVFSGEQIEQYELPQAKYKHSITVGHGNIYYSDGEKVYKINRDDSESIEELYNPGSVIGGVQYSEINGNILLDIITVSENQLLKIALK